MSCTMRGSGEHSRGGMVCPCMWLHRW
jgi:hypothetical protein